MLGRGYLIVTEPDKPVVERDTVGCGHCGAIIVLSPGKVVATIETDVGDNKIIASHCGMCRRYICGPCLDRVTCRPFEKWLDMMERRDQLRRAAARG